jgi:hypothetical protein
LETLYHYTNLEGLVNMVQTRRIWLSCLYYMNDKSEIVHAKGIAGKIIEDMSRQAPERRGLYDKIREYLDDFLTDHPVNVFSFSLTRDGNLLSQWRSYTRQNQGISIGFHASALEARAKAQGINLYPCLYEYADQQRELSATILSLVEGFVGKEEEFARDLENRLEPLMLSMCKIKNGLFYQENESRLISGYIREDRGAAGGIQYRLGKQFMIPYIELDIEGLNQDGTLFQEVFVGPSEYPSLSVSSIAQFLGKYQACAHVKNSMLPLR